MTLGESPPPARVKYSSYPYGEDRNPPLQPCEVAVCTQFSETHPPTASLYQTFRLTRVPDIVEA